MVINSYIRPTFLSNWDNGGRHIGVCDEQTTRRSPWSKFEEQKTDQETTKITFDIVEVEKYLSNHDSSVKKNDDAQENLDRVVNMSLDLVRKNKITKVWGLFLVGTWTGLLCRNLTIFSRRLLYRSRTSMS